MRTAERGAGGGTEWKGGCGSRLAAPAAPPGAPLSRMGIRQLSRGLVEKIQARSLGVEWAEKHRAKVFQYTRNHQPKLPLARHQAPLASGSSTLRRTRLESNLVTDFSTVRPSFTTGDAPAKPVSFQLQNLLHFHPIYLPLRTITAMSDPSSPPSRLGSQSLQLAR
jgi:hypothetical protein